MFCKKCGNALSDGALFCKKCGNKVGGNSAAENKPETATPKYIEQQVAPPRYTPPQYRTSVPPAAPKKSRRLRYILIPTGILATAAAVLITVLVNTHKPHQTIRIDTDYMQQNSSNMGGNTGGNTGGSTQPPSSTNLTNTTTEVGKVTNFTATDIKSSSINLKWDEDATAEGYRIYQKNGSSWDIIQTISRNSTTTFAVSGLNEGTDYDFKIVSFNGSETGGEVTCCVNTAVDGKYVDVDCTYCVGGVCSHCSGTGESSYGPYGCEWCDTKEFLGKGDGKCYICHGKGCTQSYKAGKSGSATVGNEYNTPSGGNGNGNGNNGNGGAGGGDCPKCGGQGLIKCSYCDWGFVNCTKCGGSGTYYDTYSKRVKNCPYCSAGKVSCKSCGGRGSTFCLACGGDGCV